MSVYHVPDAEELLVCPYDDVHMIRAKRYQYHLIKCRQNHLSREFATCPFNAKHEMPKPELRYHMANCPFRAVIEREIEYDEGRRNGIRVMLKGCTDVPAYNTVNPSNEENWDAEIPLHTRMGVDPSFFESLQYRNTSGMSRSARKEFYQQLRNKELERVETEAIETVSTLRIPNQTSKATMMQTTTAAKPCSLAIFSYSLSMAGIGRGRGFLQEPSEATQGRPGKSPAKNSMESFSGVGSELM